MTQHFAWSMKMGQVSVELEDVSGYPCVPSPVSSSEELRRSAENGFGDSFIANKLRLLCLVNI